MGPEGTLIARLAIDVFTYKAKLDLLEEGVSLDISGSVTDPSQFNFAHIREVIAPHLVDHGYHFTQAEQLEGSSQHKGPQAIFEFREPWY